VHKLTGHALAIELAGAFIQKRQLSFKAYAETYQQASEWTTVLKKDSRIYGKSLVAAWEISYLHIHQQLPLATEMLTCCGFMNFSRIPLALFKTTTNGEFLHQTIVTG